jgi:hypothetical protein
MAKTTYPEHEKLEALDGKNQLIGSFLDWLADEEEVNLCVYADNDRLVSYRKSTPDIIAKFFDIDPVKLEDEKRAMLDSTQKTNN